MIFHYYNIKDQYNYKLKLYQNNKTKYDENVYWKNFAKLKQHPRVLKQNAQCCVKGALQASYGGIV